METFASLDEAWARKETEEYEKFCALAKLKKTEMLLTETRANMDEEMRVNEKLMLKAKETEDELRWTLSKNFQLNECLALQEKQLIESKEKNGELMEQLRNLELRNVLLKTEIARLEEEKMGLFQSNKQLSKENRDLRKDASPYVKSQPRPEKDWEKTPKITTNAQQFLSSLGSLKNKF